MTPPIQPFFSIVIPTRDRTRTLPAAVDSVLRQDCEDFELIVVDNASAIAATQALADRQDDRLRILRAPQRLAMHRNWEFGLSACRGRYVIFIGDDDALMRDGLRQAEALLRDGEAELLCWHPHDYKWPDAAALAGQMVVRFGELAGPLDLKAHLAAAFALDAAEVYLTSIYHGAVSARLIDRVRDAQGGSYFRDPVCDIESELLNAWYGRSAIVTQRPVSMNGHSGASNGGANGRQETLSAAYDRFAAEAGLTPRDLTPGNVDLPLYHATVVAGCQERVRARHFPDEARFRYDPERLLRWIIASSANYGGVDDQASATTVGQPDLQSGFRQLANWLRITPPPIPMPARRPIRRPHRGLHHPTPDDTRLVIDTGSCGIADIGAAVALCQAMLEPAGTVGAPPSSSQSAPSSPPTLPSAEEIAARLRNEGEQAVFEQLDSLQQAGFEGWEGWDHGDTTAPLYVRFSARRDFAGARALHDELTRRGRPLWPEAIGRLRDAAIARGVPPVMLVSLPKSGSVYLQNSLIGMLRVPHIRISLSRFPNDMLLDEALRLFAAGGAVAQSHLDASRENLDALAAAGIRAIHVHVRDPRQATASWTAHMASELTGEGAFLRHLTDPLPPAGFDQWPLDRRLEWHAANHYPACLRWILQWVRVAEQDSRFSIGFTDQAVLRSAPLTVLRELLAHFGADPASVTETALRPAQREGIDHFRQGTNDEWRQLFPGAVQAWMNDLLPTQLRTRFGWPEA
ncbi:glycosyltransferase family 2 protein [Marinibaculum pumilum]|uniref:Glycosyltransferase family 2 protein n=1 Tax=Marinibaculum pumilum TaxID=1766165 RepID=A0ABV7KV63_9PROT